MSVYKNVIVPVGKASISDSPLKRRNIRFYIRLYIFPNYYSGFQLVNECSELVKPGSYCRWSVRVAISGTVRITAYQAVRHDNIITPCPPPASSLVLLRCGYNILNRLDNQIGAHLGDAVAPVASTS
jgi:hypothetical protein